MVNIKIIHQIFQYDTRYDDTDPDFFWDAGSKCYAACPAYTAMGMKCGGDTDGFYVFNSGASFALIIVFIAEVSRSCIQFFMYSTNFTFVSIGFGYTRNLLLIFSAYFFRIFFQHIFYSIYCKVRKFSWDKFSLIFAHLISLFNDSSLLYHY